MIAAAHQFAAPNLQVVVWTLLVCFELACGLVTALKGRWGWVLLGLPA